MFETRVADNHHLNKKYLVQYFNSVKFYSLVSPEKAKLMKT